LSRLPPVLWSTLLLLALALAPTSHAGVPPEPAGAASVATDVTLVPRLSAWKYNATGIDLGVTWRQTGYSDASWASGPGILGYGEPWIATTVPSGPDPNNRYKTTYFRKTFNLGVPVSSIRSLVMTANYDDGFVAYLNGVEVARRWLNSGTVGYDTLAYEPRDAGGYETIDLTASIWTLVQGSNVLAVEVHQSAPTSPDLAWDADLKYSVDPLVTRGPFLQMGTADAITVRWRTTAAAASWVRYGITPTALTKTASSAALKTDHEIRLTGLAAATRYYYSIGTATMTLAGDPSYTFRTAPVAGTVRPTRVWVIGDSGHPGTTAYEVRDAYAAWTGSRGTDMWLMLGDNAYEFGTDSDYQGGAFDQYPSMLRQSVLWPTRGNHDMLYTGSNNDYYELLTMPAAAEAGGVSSGSEAYYSFDWANIHFICLDSQTSDRSPGGPMLTWLMNDLTANTRRWVVAYWHHPPYSKGKHDSDDIIDSGGRMRDMRENALPILEAKGADLVLTGHSHAYERSFLLDGHYGVSTTLTPAMIRNGGDGAVDGDGPYLKSTTVPSPHSGTVYAVVGGSSMLETGPLNHPAMAISLAQTGSLVLDVDGNRLDARYLSQTGVVLDSFTVVKDATVGVAGEWARVGGVRLGPGVPNPFAQELRLGYSLERAGRVRLTLHDVGGRCVATAEEGWRVAGTHVARWDGRDVAGRPLPTGIYLAVLESDGVRVSRKVALVR
jgi:calcineurin-like phosphoesterase family protein/purple acid phosphatase-like protein/flagellar hook capping protein FlgD